MIDTNALRKKILELAVQGKLTQGYRENPFNRAIAQKNCPHEGGGSGFGEAKDERGLIYLSAEELYNQIQAEKQRLIAEGKIKKEKPLPTIKEEEIPFEIPRTWKWVRIIDIVNILNGDRGKNYPAKSTLSNKGIPFISAINLDGKTVVDDDRLMCLTDEQYEKLSNGKLKQGDIVVCIRGSLGKHGRYPFEKGAIASSLIILREYLPSDITADYIMHYLDTNLFFDEIDSFDNGSAQPNLSACNFKKFLIPLPPLTEQYSIVEAIEKSFEELSIIDEMQKSLSSDAVSFKKKILELAIQGKLVEQRLEDGNAEELYCQILAEKQRLIAEGKLKKEKPLPPTKEEEIPFEIPKTWKWVRIIDIVNILNGDRGKNYPAKSTLSNKGIPFISAINLDGKTVVNDEKLMCLTDEQYEKLSNGKLKQGDIVVCIRGSLGKHGRYPFEKGAIASSLIILREYLPSDVTADYIMHYLDTNLFFDEIDYFDNGTAQPNLSACNFKNFLLPLPPLTEQQRIVAKIEQLFAIADKLINK